MKKIVVALLIALIGLSCSKKEGTIKIGAVLPLSGSASDYGNKTKNGIDLALTEINDSVGIGGRRLEVIYEDDKLDPKDGVNAITKLIDINKVSCVIGPISSGVVLAVAPIANEKHIVVLSTYASNYKITSAGDFIFRIYPSDAVQGITDAETAVNLGFRKAAILYVNSDYGVGLKIVFSEQFPKLGGKITIAEAFEMGDTDFRSQLTKIKQSKPDVIFIPGNAKELGLILRQIKQQDIRNQIIATDSFLESTVLKIAGKAAENVIFTTLQENKDSIQQDFDKKYKDKYGTEPGLLESLGYDGLRVLSLAISKGGENPDSIKNALYSIKDYHGVTGRISFDQNGDISGSFAVKEVRDGKIIDYHFEK
jgi:branched-chain amino acid transport system substrate-binding protein